MGEFAVVIGWLGVVFGRDLVADCGFLDFGECVLRVFVGVFGERDGDVGFFFYWVAAFGGGCVVCVFRGTRGIVGFPDAFAAKGDFGVAFDEGGTLDCVAAFVSVFVVADGDGYGVEGARADG